MKKAFFWLLTAAIVLGLIWWFWRPLTPVVAPTASNEPSPSASVSPSPSVTAGPAITMTTPKIGDTVDSPIFVTGRARVFENQLTVQVKDNTGHVVASEHVFTDAKDAGQYGTYTTHIVLPPGTATATMTVEALAESPKGDGSLQGDATAKVTLKYTDSMNVYAGFLTNPKSCTELTLYPRDITKTSQFVYMSVVALLQGPTQDERGKGATTEIPDGVQINSLKQTGSTAYVDFNNALVQGITPNSCRAQGITSQITGTLKQFLGLTDVVITINGKPNPLVTQ